MRTAKIKCSLPLCSEHAVCIVDTNNRTAYIPDSQIINKQRDENGLVSEITIPLWLAIDRKLNYQE